MNYVYTKDADWTCPKQCEHCQSRRPPFIQRPYGADQSSYFCANCGELMWTSQPPGTRAKIEAMLKREAEIERGAVDNQSYSRGIARRVWTIAAVGITVWLMTGVINGIIEGVSRGR